MKLLNRGVRITVLGVEKLVEYYVVVVKNTYYAKNEIVVWFAEIKLWAKGVDGAPLYLIGSFASGNGSVR